MSDEYLIRNCAPTLAGLKTGSMFTCPCEDRNQLLSALRQINLRLKDKGLRIIPLRFSQFRALIYLYRPGKLSHDLSNREAASLLHIQGYESGCCEKILSQLMKKLRSQTDFPHEIGLFLGYPVEDVRGFMENDACGCKCVGCWKVYGDEDAARKTFFQYKMCSQVYLDQWRRGKPIEKLTVAN